MKLTYRDIKIMAKALAEDEKAAIYDMIEYLGLSYLVEGGISCKPDCYKDPDWTPPLGVLSTTMTVNRKATDPIEAMRFTEAIDAFTTELDDAMDAWCATINEQHPDQDLSISNGHGGYTWTAAADGAVEYQISVYIDFMWEALGD